MPTFLFILIFSFASLAKPNPFYLGNWDQDCKTIGEDDIVKYMLLIDDKFMDQIIIAYEEENCHTPYLVFKRQYQFRSIKISTQETTTNLDVSVVKVTYTSLTDEVTEALNLISYCGETDWKTFQEKNVTGRTCQDYEVPTVGTIVNQMFSTKTGSELFLNSDPTPFFKLMM